MEMVYCLPGELSVPNTSSPLKNLVLDVDYNDMLIVIKDFSRCGTTHRSLTRFNWKIRRHLRHYRRRDTNFLSHQRVAQKIVDFTQKMFNVYLKMRCNEHFINWRQRGLSVKHLSNNSAYAMNK